MAPSAPSAVKTTPNLTAPAFNIVSKAISVDTDPDTGERRFHLTASSTIEDLAGDEIDVAALQKAAVQFQQGKTIFMDHDFQHVESAFGLTDRAEVVQKGVDPESGKPIYDLDIFGKVNTPNPRAAQLADSIDGGYVRLGASLTAFVRKHAKKPGGRGMIIKDIDIVEASVVGVAENQRSWAHKAAFAVKSFRKPEWLTEDDEETIVTKDASIDETHSTEEEATAVETGAPESPEVVNEAPAAKADVCPECGQSRETTGCSNGYHAEATEASAESKTGGQESAQETPETAPDGDEAETDTPLEKVAAFDPNDVAELVKQAGLMAAEIGHLRAENARLADEIKAASDAKEAVSKEVDLATQVIGEVMKQPLRPRTAGFVADFQKAHTLFDPDVAAYLEKRERTTVK